MNEKAIIETVKVVQPKLRREDLLQVLKYRYATKAWDKDKKISDEDMQTILEAARLAPRRLALSLGKSSSCRTRKSARPSGHMPGVQTPHCRMPAISWCSWRGRKQISHLARPILNTSRTTSWNCPSRHTTCSKRPIRDSAATSIKSSSPSARPSTGRQSRPISSWPTSSLQQLTWASTPARSKASRRIRSRRF